jgi:hypothetical protein
MENGNWLSYHWRCYGGLTEHVIPRAAVLQSSWSWLISRPTVSRGMSRVEHVEGISELPQCVNDGSLPGCTQFKRVPKLPQILACEYAGCICIVVVVVIVPKASAITAAAIVMASFCINNLYYNLIHIYFSFSG